MCPPALGIAVAVMSSVVSFAASTADYNAKSAQWKQNYVNAIQSGTDDQKALHLRMVQEEEGFAQADRLNKVEGAEIAAEAEVSAGSAGVSGVSLANIMTGIQRKVDLKHSADKTNYLNTAQQLTNELKATKTATLNKINSVQRPVAPSALAAVVGGIGGALKAAG